MYETRNKKSDLLNIENILKLVNEAEIYRYYLGFDFEIKQLFSSPFRRDDTPSFGIIPFNGTLIFNDLGDKKIKGNVFKFVSLITNKNFKDSLRDINENMNLGLFDPDLHVYQNIAPTNSIIKYNDYENLNIKNLENKEVSLQIVTRNFNNIDKEYWSSGEIHKKTLDFFNVYPTTKVFKDNFIIWKETKNNPIYSWNIDNTIKSYRPLENNPKAKWVTNCNKNYIQGLSQLMLNTLESKDLFISKSMKDIMIYYECGLNSIAPQSENTYLEYELIDYLKNHYNCIINFDNDEAGIKSAYWYWNNFNIPLFFIPSNSNCKDPFEFTQKYNLITFKQLIKNEALH